MEKRRAGIVTGASRGIGRGVATALHDAGYVVYATGRSIANSNLPTGVNKIACDHLRDDQTERAFATVLHETSSMDVLVNCAWGGYEQMAENGRFTWPDPFEHICCRLFRLAVP